MAGLICMVCWTELTHSLFSNTLKISTYRTVSYHMSPTTSSIIW